MIHPHHFHILTDTPDAGAFRRQGQAAAELPSSIYPGSCIVDSWCIWTQCDIFLVMCMSSILQMHFFPKPHAPLESLESIQFHGSQVMKALNEKRAKRDHLKEQALRKNLIIWSGFENTVAEKVLQTTEEQNPKVIMVIIIDHHGIKVSSWYHSLFQFSPTFSALFFWRKKVDEQRTQSKLSRFFYNKEMLGRCGQW